MLSNNEKLKFKICDTSVQLKAVSLSLVHFMGGQNKSKKKLD